MSRNTQTNPQNDDLLLSEDQCSTPDTPTDQSKAGEVGSGSPALSVSKDEFDRLQKERDSLFDRLARLQAEFDNFRKRNAREQTEFREYATAEAAKNFLPVLDNFNLALKSNSDQNLRQGVELIRKQMEDVLARMGVEAIPAEGQQFDPRFHEAIEMVDTSDVPDHQIIEELQRGYRVKDRLLRPAMVRVARNAASKAS